MVCWSLVESVSQNDESVEIGIQLCWAQVISPISSVCTALAYD